ncbi:nudC domain-containing protein 2 [Ambystoma mexicanum]|uniref:nudC domain-containing protein 2 n=1 Tax=Ambystoma mexicanum TaxID=8296 RepID=UPI0037E72157
MSMHFDERSGVVPCRTSWGLWYQTMEEVYIEVAVPPGTTAKEVQCVLESRHLSLIVRGKNILKGKLFGCTIVDEGTWTLEDRKLIRIVLMKSNRDAGNCWPSLLENEYAADPWVQDEMQKKLTLERFQRETPGFDFSGADISGNYSKGGPDFSNLGK